MHTVHLYQFLEFNIFTPIINLELQMINVKLCVN